MGISSSTKALCFDVLTFRRCMSSRSVNLIDQYASSIVMNEPMFGFDYKGFPVRAYEMKDYGSAAIQVFHFC